MLYWTRGTIGVVSFGLNFFSLLFFLSKWRGLLNPKSSQLEIVSMVLRLYVFFFCGMLRPSWVCPSQKKHFRYTQTHFFGGKK